MTQITHVLCSIRRLRSARFYTSVFKNSRIINTSYYSEAGPRPAGTVLEVSFELDGQHSWRLTVDRSSHLQAVRLSSIATGKRSGLLLGQAA